MGLTKRYEFILVHPSMLATLLEHLLSINNSLVAGTALCERVFWMVYTIVDALQHYASSDR
jgi:hypothetical protein